MQNRALHQTRDFFHDADANVVRDVTTNGTLDSNILIRTFVIKDGWVQCRVGGGVTAKSSPGAEYQETLYKAEGMLRALQKKSIVVMLTSSISAIQKLSSVHPK